MTDKPELIAVFKKDVTREDAQALLTATGVQFRKGMDSSRGKIYFYATDPKFILTFETAQQREKFMRDHQSSEIIHELYEPDWKIQKD